MKFNRILIVAAAMACVATFNADAHLLDKLTNKVKQLTHKEQSSKEPAAEMAYDAEQQGEESVFGTTDLSTIDPKIKAQIEKFIGTDMMDLLKEYDMQHVAINDPQYEWSQYDDKFGKSEMKDNFLELEAKKDDTYGVTVTELPLFTPERPFIFGVWLKEADINDEKGVGIVFDVADNRNYKTIMVTKKNYMYTTCKEGITSIVKRGLIKHGKFGINMMIRLENDKMHFYLNGLEQATVNKVSVENQNFGVIVSPKGKCKLISFSFGIPVETSESEQSTSET